MSKVMIRAAEIVMSVIGENARSVEYIGEFGSSGHRFVITWETFQHWIYVHNSKLYGTKDGDLGMHVKAIAAYIVMEAKAYRSAMLDVMKSEIDS
jgi:hypothetical protein